MINEDNRDGVSCVVTALVAGTLDWNSSIWSWIFWSANCWFFPARPRSFIIKFRFQITVSQEFLSPSTSMLSCLVTLFSILASSNNVKASLVANKFAKLLKSLHVRNSKIIKQYFFEFVELQLYGIQIGSFSCFSKIESHRHKFLCGNFDVPFTSPKVFSSLFLMADSPIKHLLDLRIFFFSSLEQSLRPCTLLTVVSSSPRSSCFTQEDLNMTAELPNWSNSASLPQTT